jgi:hypothetical protein
MQAMVASEEVLVVDNWGTKLITVKGDGKVGIGTATPATTLDLSGTLEINHYSQTANGYRIGAVADGSVLNIGFWSAGAWYTGNPALNIAYDGRVGIGDTTPSYLLDIGPDAGASVELNVQGSIECVAVHETSDRKLKKNIEPLSYGTDKLMLLKPVSFDWNEKAPAPGHSIGFVAQEVDEVVPEAVATDANGKKAIAYSKLIPVLVQTIQEQQAEIEALKKAVAALAK